MDCGCDVEWDGATDATRKVYVVHCPMHAVAAEMLEVLQTIENDENQVPPWLWTRIQTTIGRAGGRVKA